MTTPEHSPETTIERLTHCNLQGIPYDRPSTVEHQIRAALILGPHDLLARARMTDQDQPGYVQEETLAYLIRRAHRAADDDLVNHLTEVLIRRCTRFLKAQLDALRGDQREEAIAETIAELTALLVEPDGSDRGDFLQVRFWLVVRRLAIAAFKRAVQQATRDRALVTIDASGAGFETDDEQSVELSDPLTVDPQARLLIDEALALLAPHVRQAFVMKVEGWPVEDRDPSVPTISRYFGKTSRTIRNWLAQADARLAAWRAEEARS